LPDLATLLGRIRAAASGERREDQLWELDELVIEADAASRAPAELPRAFARAALANGTAFAVLTLASNPDLMHLPEAGVAFGTGVVGALAAVHFGRLASKRAQKTRAHWSALAREARRALDDEPAH
jgi:hypothetical protein